MGKITFARLTIKVLNQMLQRRYRPAVIESTVLVRNNKH